MKQTIARLSANPTACRIGHYALTASIAVALFGGLYGFLVLSLVALT